MKAAKGALRGPAGSAAPRPRRRRQRHEDAGVASPDEQGFRSALPEFLDHEAAIREVLRLIVRTQSSAQPVFDAIAAAALRLCSATSASVFTFDGKLLHLAALERSPADQKHGMVSQTDFRRYFPRPLGRDLAAPRAVLTGSVVSIPDVLADPEYGARETALADGVRSVLAVPILRNGAPIGAIAIGRAMIGSLSERHVALLQTFADQAAIAIENVRLFRELQARNDELSQTLEQQTATSEILRVISRSPGDTQPVFETIAAAAMRLCDARSANVFTFDGELLHIGALAVAMPEAADAVRGLFPRPPDRGTAASRAVLTRRVVAVSDVLQDPDYMFQGGAQLGFRSVLGIPLLRDGEPIGAIAIGRPASGPFPDSQIALLQTFADQAVIAIENVRLFKELQARTRELAQSVEQLQALAEVGQAVSSTLELETVQSTIVARAIQLVGVDGGAVFEYDEAEQAFRLHAADGLPDELVDALRATRFPRGEGAIGKMALTGAPVAISDTLDEGMYQSRVREILIRHGYRSLLAVPLLRESRLLGGLVVNRKRAGGFDARTVGLLRTFATQSALAIHNARLYREIEDKRRQLEIASRHKSAFLANMSHELRTPLNAIIGFTRIVLRQARDQIETKQYENLEKILASAQHLLSLINAVLDIAKVEAGRVEVHAVEVLLPAVLERCTRTVEPLLRDGVTLEKHFGASLPPIVADEEKLRQIVINLLSNAAKFTARGTIRLSAKAADGEVAVAVADTGIGIPADKLESIFEEFEQVDASSTREHGGTGLGLAIARQLARLLGGDIRVDSTLGAGSTFTLTLPLRDRAGAP
jgi:signal transduction histidine kinase